jgi:hypothetical protein
LNPKLVAFLLVSMLAGLIAATAMMISGWGVFAALAAHSVAGSLSLFTLSIVAVGFDGGPAPAAERLPA